jgi:dTDP-4-dehydrorhamnose reductase
MMMKTLVLGRGFLGHRIATALGAELPSVDIADERAVGELLDAMKPTAVVNAAGKTGRPNVDWCETHRVETARANTEGPIVLARACAARGIYLLHLGSGCIFYGDSPSPGGWREADFANPSAFYSRTKYAADLVLSRLPAVAILRLRMPIDVAPGPRNLITKLSGYSQVVDVENSVTVVDDLLHVVRKVLEARPEGIFHAVNPGTMRHADLLALYRELVDPDHRATLIREEELVARGLATHGRSNCILVNERLPALGIHMRPIDQALRDCLTQYAATRRTA